MFITVLSLKIPPNFDTYTHTNKQVKNQMLYWKKYLQIIAQSSSISYVKILWKSLRITTNEETGAKGTSSQCTEKEAQEA